MEKTAAHIMSSIEVLWNEANSIEAFDPMLLLSDDDIYYDSPKTMLNKPSKVGFASYEDLGKRVEQASQYAPDTKTTLPPADAINRIKDVTRLRPNSALDVDTNSPEYLFGDSFTNLVRHIVVDYLDKSVEPIIREAITSEIRKISNKKNKK